MELLDVNQRGFDNFVNTLMQIEAQKAAQYNAGLQGKVEQLMNMKEYDPAAKQNFIDAMLQTIGIETKNTKGVKINEALDKIDLHRYGTDYSDIFDFSQPKRGELAKALFGEYDPNYQAPTMEELANFRAQNREARMANSKSTFEPMGKNVSAIIAEDKAKTDSKSGSEGDKKGKTPQRIQTNGNVNLSDTEFLKLIQAQNRANMSSAK